MNRIKTLAQHLTSATADKHLASNSLKKQTNQSLKTQLLEGIVILDLSQMVSGPLATQILADQGADVIKVEPLNGEAGRVFSTGSIPVISHSINRNKRSLAIDLKSKDGRNAFNLLLKKADVVVHNFRPGVIERMGLSEEEIRKVNQNIIFVEISGFGQTGPMSQRRVYDPIIQAVSGMASAQGSSERPKMIRLLVPDQITAMVASQAITTAIVHKLRTGEGQTVQLNMLDTAIWYMWPEAMISQVLLGPEGDLMRSMDLSSRDMIFETKDKQFITASAVSDTEWAALCRAIEKEEWIEDDRFDNAIMRRINANERLNLLEETIGQFNAADLLSKMEKLDVPHALVSHPREKVIENEQVKHNKILFEVEHPHPNVGRVLLCKPPASFSKSSFGLRQHAPLAGENSRDVLVDIAGLSGVQVDKMIADGHVIVRTLEED